MLTPRYTTEGYWRFYSTGLIAARGSSLPTYSISNSSGTVNAIYVLRVDATGSLGELVWDRAVDYSRFFKGESVISKLSEVCDTVWSTRPCKGKAPKSAIQTSDRRTT